MTRRVALVAGASRGLGFSLGVEAARRGAHVVAVARTVGGLEELDDAVKTAGGAATLVPLDLRDDEGLARMGAALFERFGRLDLWLHCAASAPPLSPVSHAEAKAVDESWAVTARATQRLIRVLDPLLRAAEAPVAALFDDRCEGRAFFATYAAAKAAQRAFWTAWAVETRKTALRAPLVLPPPMPTALRARFFPGEDRARLTRTDEIARRSLDALEAARTSETIDLRGGAPD